MCVFVSRGGSIWAWCKARKGKRLGLLDGYFRCGYFGLDSSDAENFVERSPPSVADGCARRSRFGFIGIARWPYRTEQSVRQSCVKGDYIPHSGQVTRG